MDNYTLRNDGDVVEQKFCDYILDEFPNYEIFWKNHVIPWTNRDILPKGDINWIKFRRNVPQFIEELCMVHYSVFKDLSLVIKETENDRYDEDSLRKVFIYFGHAIEMAYSLAVKIVIAQKEVNLIDEQIFIKKNESELVESVKDFIKKHYESKFEDYKNKQIPVVYSIHGTRHFIKRLVNDEQDFKDLDKYFYSVLGYRNIYTHSPLPGQLYAGPDSNHVIRKAIKKDKLNKYRRWTDITRSVGRNLDDFVDEGEFIVAELKKIKQKLNVLWGYYLNHMKVVYETDILKELLAKTSA